MSTTNPYILSSLLRAREKKEKKKPQPIAKVSEKRAAQLKEEKNLRAGDDTIKEKWFKARRVEMVGTCQCGCGMPSQKNDDLYFRHSAAHIFPKGIFPSVMYHPLNCVERRFWATSITSACHTNMDEQGLDKWPAMADWEDIREKFFILAPMLTDEERATKFYQKLEKLVYQQPK